MTEKSIIEISHIVKQQQDEHHTNSMISFQERMLCLKKLEHLIIKNKNEIKNALYADMSKSELEAEITEIYPILQEIKHAKRHLKQWLRKQEVRTPLSLIGSKSFVLNEAKGVVLIISPWNFPFNLTFSPLISAIAAGNRIIIKPSEISSNSGNLIEEIINKNFESNYIYVANGGIEVSKFLLEQKFHHVFFTGSTSVGKKVMEAAAKNLSTVTLELGGKSPTIVDKSASIKTAAKRIAWAKYINNGQICIAPDYIFVHESIEKELISHLKSYLQKFYGKVAYDSKDYGRIISENHCQRIINLMQDALENGAELVHGGNFLVEEKFFEPTIIRKVSKDCKQMQEEIFGPILPIMTYQNIDEVVNFINSRDKALQLYLFTNDKKTKQKIMLETSSGGCSINHCLIQYNNLYLPFGGINQSGIGKSHGYAGFLEFTNAKSVFIQSKFTLSSILILPYSLIKVKIIKFVLKYF